MALFGRHEKTPDVESPNKKVILKKSPTSPPNQDLAKRNQTYLLKLTITFFQSDVLYARYPQWGSQNHSEPHIKFKTFSL